MKFVLIAALVLASPTGLSPEQERTAAEVDWDAWAVQAVAQATEEDAANGTVYHADLDADGMVAAAFTRARENGHMVLIALGGNWCHDSRALAQHFETPMFRAMLQSRYELIYVDVGHRDRNLQIPARYGVAALTGTPTVLIISPEGQLLNRGTAASWRNAASRSRQNIFAHFRNFGGR